MLRDDLFTQMNIAYNVRVSSVTKLLKVSDCFTGYYELKKDKY